MFKSPKAIREQHERATLPARYAARKSCFDPPVPIDEWDARVARELKVYSEKMRVLRAERARVENECMMEIARSAYGQPMKDAKRMHKLEKLNTKGQIAALEAEYKTALTK